MQKMFNAVFNGATRSYEKAIVGVGLVASSAIASAQSASDGISSALDAVDLSGVATKVGAAALIVVAVALVFKGPDIAKRVIRKV